MVELLVGMIIVALLSALSVSGYSSYQRSVEQSGSAQELVSALRNAQQRALSEAATYCMTLNVSARSHQLSKFACGTAGTPEPAKTTRSARVLLQSPIFQQAGGGTAPTVIFYPRGSATKGSVLIAREDSSQTYTIDVEGLTGRVSLRS